MKKRRIAAIIAAAAMVLALLSMSGCNKMVDEYESDTFELGEAAVFSVK